MTATETRNDLYNRDVSVYFASKFTTQSINKGADSGVVSIKQLSVEGLNDAPDEIKTTEVITGYHDEERTRIDTIEKKVYIEDEEDVVAEMQNLWIQSGANYGDGMFLTLYNMDSDILGIKDIDVSTFKGASEAIEKSQKASGMVSKFRSILGAQQNRLEHTIQNVTNNAENTQEAESRIRDNDMAKEMVVFSTQSVLEQMGVSMLAQANQSSQAVLSLLG